MAGLFALAFLVSLVLFPLGLIRPSLFSRFLPNSRKIQSLVFGGIFIFSTIMIGITSPSVPSTTQGVQENKKEIKGTSTSQVSPAPIDKVAPTQKPTATSTEAPTTTIKTRPTLIPAPTKAPTLYQLVPTNTPVPVVNIQSNSQQNTSGGYSCNCAKTCTQISSCEEAQYLLNSCGCSARDGDKDGVACDGAPLHCQN